MQYVVRSIGDPDQVYEIAEEIKNRAQASGRFIVVQNSLAFDQPQALVTIDRDRAAALGVAVSDIGETLTALVGGGSVSKFDLANRSYDVITQVADPQRFNPESLGDLLRAERQRFHGAAVRRRHDRDARLAGRGRAVQPAELRHDLGAPAARRRDRRCARRHPADRRAR